MTIAINMQSAMTIVIIAVELSMADIPLRTGLITGASSGFGATYADCFARRGHDLVLVARDRDRMERLARDLRVETGVSTDMLSADLTEPRELARIETRLREDGRICRAGREEGEATVLLPLSLAHLKACEARRAREANGTRAVRKVHAA